MRKNLTNYWKEAFRQLLIVFSIIYVRSQTLRFVIKILPALKWLSFSKEIFKIISVYHDCCSSLDRKHLPVSSESSWRSERNSSKISFRWRRSDISFKYLQGNISENLYANSLILTENFCYLNWLFNIEIWYQVLYATSISLDKIVIFYGFLNYRVVW